MSIDNQWASNAECLHFAGMRGSDAEEIINNKTEKSMVGVTLEEDREAEARRAADRKLFEENVEETLQFTGESGGVREILWEIFEELRDKGDFRGERGKYEFPLAIVEEARANAEEYDSIEEIARAVRREATEECISLANIEALQKQFDPGEVLAPEDWRRMRIIGGPGAPILTAGGHSRELKRHSNVYLKGEAQLNEKYIERVEWKEGFLYPEDMFKNQVERAEVGEETVKANIGMIHAVDKPDKPGEPAGSGKGARPIGNPGDINNDEALELNREAFGSLKLPTLTDNIRSFRRAKRRNYQAISEGRRVVANQDDVVRAFERMKIDPNYTAATGFRLTGGWLIFFLTAYFGWCAFPLIWGVIMRLILLCCRQAQVEDIEAYMDDFTYFVEEGQALQARAIVHGIIRRFLGESAINESKSLLAMVLIVIQGWLYDLIRETVALSDKNIRKSVFQLLMIPRDYRVSVRTFQSLSGRGIRSAQVVTHMRQWNRYWTDDIKGLRDTNVVKVMSEGSKAAVIAWRICLVRALMDPTSCTRSFASFDHRGPIVCITADASPQGLSARLFHLDAYGTMGHCFSVVWFMFDVRKYKFAAANDPAFQNVAEFMAVVLAMFQMAALGFHKVDFFLIGDSVVSSAYVRHGSAKTKSLKTEAARAAILEICDIQPCQVDAHVAGEANFYDDRNSRGGNTGKSRRVRVKEAYPADMLVVGHETAWCVELVDLINPEVEAEAGELFRMNDELRKIIRAWRMEARVAPHPDESNVHLLQFFVSAPWSSGPIGGYKKGRKSWSLYYRTHAPVAAVLEEVRRKWRLAPDFPLMISVDRLKYVITADDSRTCEEVGLENGEILYIVGSLGRGIPGAGPKSLAQYMEEKKDMELAAASVWVPLTVLGLENADRVVSSPARDEGHVFTCAVDRVHEECPCVERGHFGGDSTWDVRYRFDSTHRFDFLLQVRSLGVHEGMLPRNVPNNRRNRDSVRALEKEIENSANTLMMIKGALSKDHGVGLNRIVRNLGIVGRLWKETEARELRAVGYQTEGELQYEQQRPDDDESVRVSIREEIGEENFVIAPAVGKKRLNMSRTLRKDIHKMNHLRRKCRRPYCQKINVPLAVECVDCGNTSRGNYAYFDPVMGSSSEEDIPDPKRVAVAASQGTRSTVYKAKDSNQQAKAVEDVDSENQKEEDGDSESSDTSRDSKCHESNRYLALRFEAYWASRRWFECDWCGVSSGLEAVLCENQRCGLARVNKSSSKQFYWSCETCHEANTSKRLDCKACHGERGGDPVWHCEGRDANTVFDEGKRPKVRPLLRMGVCRTFWKDSEGKFHWPSHTVFYGGNANLAIGTVLGYGRVRGWHSGADWNSAKKVYLANKQQYRGELVRQANSREKGDVGLVLDMTAPRGEADCIFTHILNPRNHWDVMTLKKGSDRVNCRRVVAIDGVRYVAEKVIKPGDQITCVGGADDDLKSTWEIVEKSDIDDFLVRHNLVPFTVEESDLSIGTRDDEEYPPEQMETITDVGSGPRELADESDKARGVRLGPGYSSDVGSDGATSKLSAATLSMLECLKKLERIREARTGGDPGAPTPRDRNTEEVESEGSEVLLPGESEEFDEQISVAVRTQNQYDKQWSHWTTFLQGRGQMKRLFLRKMTNKRRRQLAGRFIIHMGRRLRFSVKKIYYVCSAVKKRFVTEGEDADVWEDSFVKHCKKSFRGMAKVIVKRKNKRKRKPLPGAMLRFMKTVGADGPSAVAAVLRRRGTFLGCATMYTLGTRYCIVGATPSATNERSGLSEPANKHSLTRDDLEFDTTVGRLSLVDLAELLEAKGNLRSRDALQTILLAVIFHIDSDKIFNEVKGRTEVLYTANTEDPEKAALRDLALDIAQWALFESGLSCARLATRDSMIKPYDGTKLVFAWAHVRVTKKKSWMYEGMLQSKDMTALVKAAATNFGFDPAEFSVYSLRHGGATDLKEQGKSLREIGKFMGHAEGSTSTDGYCLHLGSSVRPTLTESETGLSVKKLENLTRKRKLVVVVENSANAGTESRKSQRVKKPTCIVSM